MARHLFIAGIDRNTDYIKDSLTIEQVLTQAVDTCSFSIRGEKPEEGQEVIIEDDTLGRLFGGIIDRVQLTDYSRDAFRVWQVDAQDYTYQLDRKLVVETYQNMAADEIARDIITKYGGGIFTTNHIQTGAPVVEEIVFDYVAPSAALKDLADYVGWDWYVDYDRDIWFFDPASLGQPAPLSLEPGGYFRNLKHTIDQQGLRNRVYVRGGTMLSDPWTYEIKADGSARAWVLPHKPHDVTVMVAGVAKTCGIENVHEESEYDFLMNYEEKYVRCSAQTPTPAQGVTLSFTYRYDIDVITMVEDIASQQAIAKVQGGDGVYEHVIVDDSLTTIDAAEAAGNADLREHANPQVKGSFETEVNGWQPGQLVTINLPDRGIQGTFLVQKVTITPCTPEKWTYRVEYGGRLLGIADWLTALYKAQQKKKLNETALLHKFHYGAEMAKVTDEVQGTLRTPPWVVEEGQEILVQPVEIASVEASFSRSSVAYKSDGTQVAANTPRFEQGKFGNAIMIEEGTTNLAHDPNSDNAWWNAAPTSGIVWGLSNDWSATEQALKVRSYSSKHHGHLFYLDIQRDVWFTLRAKIKNVKNALYNQFYLALYNSAGACIETNYVPEILAQYNWTSHNTLDYTEAWITYRIPSGVYTDAVKYTVQLIGNGTSESEIYLKDIQLEQKPYRTTWHPYNSTRSPETLTIPGSVLNPQRGEVAILRQMDIASNNPPSGVHRNIFSLKGVVWGIFVPNSTANEIQWAVGSWSSLVRVTTTWDAKDCLWIFAEWDLPNATLHVYNITKGTHVYASITNAVSITVPSLAYIGCADGRDFNAHCNGLIDDLRISNRARTNEEIAAAYASGQPLPVDEWTTCKLNLDGTLAFPGGVIAVERQLQTVGSLLSLTAPVQIATSFDGQDWTEYQDAEKYIEVPYPGYVKVKSDKRTWVYNWKKPFVESDTVCGFVVCG